MASIVVDEVEKKFGDQWALYPSSLKIEEGEFVVFVGPSGCGKTTFLRLIAGLEEVTDGKIFIGDRDVTWVEAKSRGVAMVFQNYALYPHLTVEQNLMYPLNILKLSKAEKKERVETFSKMLEIDGLLSRKPAELSGGQKQRVAIGRALVRRPQIFLFDEPLSNLDARLREQMRLEIVSLHNKLQRTSIFVTHDQHEAMTLAERLVVLNKGKIVQVGKPLELYRDPDTLFVAKFLGNPPINTLTGEMNGNQKFIGDFGQFSVEQSISDNVTKMTAAFRAEDIEIGTSEKHPTLKGQVRLIEQLGSAAHVQIAVANSLVWVITKESSSQVGEEVSLVLKPEKILWFCSETEQRLR